MALYGFLQLFFCNFFNRFLNMNNGMILYSLPVSILHGITMVFLPDCISSFANNKDQFLFKWTELILTVSILPSLPFCAPLTSSSFTALSLLLWHTFLKWPVLLQPVHVLSYVRHCLSASSPPQHLHEHHWSVVPGGHLVLSSFTFFTIFTLSNCL